MVEVAIPTTKDAIKFSKDAAIGAASAVISKTLIAPIERVKLILQLQASQKTITLENRYNGMLDCFYRVPKEQGFLSFWRGNYSNVIRASSQESLGMAFKEFFKIWLLKDIDKEKQRGRFLVGNLLAGGISGMVTFCFIYPLDFSRTRLAVDMGKDQASREFKGLMDCFLKIHKHDGLCGLYRGFLPSLPYIFIYRSTYYGLFDTLKKLYAEFNHESDISFIAALFIAQAATFVAAGTSYPLDTVRRRLMMQSGMKVREYNGTMDCIKKIYKAEGINSFFSGFFVNSIRGIGAALILAFYNDISKYI